MPVQALPAVRGNLATAAAYEKRLAGLPDDRSCRRQPRIEAVAGRDADFHLIELLHILRHVPYGRRRQPRHGACPADDADVRRTCLGVECADAGDEGSRVREVDVVAACRDARPCQPIVLLLERARGVDENGGRQCLHVRGCNARGIEGGVIDVGRVRSIRAWWHAHVPCLLSVRR